VQNHQSRIREANVKTLIYVLFLTTCGFLVVGWFLDWYTVQDIRSSPGKHRLEIEIDTEKIRQDIERGRKKLEETWRRMHQPQEHAEQEPRLSLRSAQR
jgi:hypothetical protein